MFIAKRGFRLDFHWDVHLASWHVSCALAMLAVILSQNVLEKWCGTSCETKNLSVIVKLTNFSGNTCAGVQPES